MIDCGISFTSFWERFELNILNQRMVSLETKDPQLQLVQMKSENIELRDKFFYICNLCHDITYKLDILLSFVINFCNFNG